jgi:simple sugar transport system permease protein
LSENRQQDTREPSDETQIGLLSRIQADVEQIRIKLVNTAEEAPRPIKAIIVAVAKLLTWNFWKPVIWALFSVILAAITSAAIMELSGYNSYDAFSALIIGASRQFDRVLFFSTPLILTGLSVAFVFKSGLFNIGAEGQLYMGSMAAAILGYIIPLPYGVHPLVCLASGALAGALWGFLPGLLKAYRGAHEVVTTMMLSYTAILFCQWLAAGPLKEPGEYQWNAQTTRILETAELQNIWGNYLHAGFLVAIICVFVVAFILNRTVMGYEMRAVGLNEAAAETAGINTKKNVALSLAIGGGLAGLAGASEVQGNLHRFYDGWSPGLGFDGITVAVLGNNNPFGCLLAAIFFGFLRAGGNAMHQQAHVPIEMVGVMQGLVVLFVAAPRFIQWMADQSLDYGKWFSAEKARPIQPIVFALNMVMALYGAYFSFSMLSETQLGLTFIGISAVVSILSIAAFLLILARNSRGLIVSLVVSMCWFALAVIGMGAGINIGFIILVGLVQAVLSVLSLLLMKGVGQSKGGGA